MSLPANITSLMGNLQAAQQATPDTSTGDFLYLKMTKSGEWVYGSEDTEVGSDSVFVIDPNTYAQGYVAWDDGSLVDERMAVAGSPAVTMADLPQLANGAKWDSQVAFALRGIEGQDEGVQLLYKVSSRGGKGAISELLGKIIARGQAGEAAVCPVVLLDTSSYKHKKFGKIYTPILTVDEWLDLPDSSEPAAAPVKAVAEPAPVAEPVEEPVAEPVEEPAATGRKKRSRRSA